MSQTAAAGGIIILALLGVSKAILPHAPPITVHSISLDPVTGIVTQDRTATAKNWNDPVRLMNWAAQVVDLDTGNSIPGCTGSGSWPYKVGRVSADLPLEEWVGNERCRLEGLDRTFFLRAVYSADGIQVVAESAPVVVP
jgi:hypothetical protein